MYFCSTSKAYLPGTEVNGDPQGRSSRARLYHCTPVWLTLAIAPNVGDSGAQFMVVGDCVRALPCKMQLKFIIFLALYNLENP